MNVARCTGVDLAEAKLEDTATVANDDDEAPTDPDEFLPWPDGERVVAWWEKKAARFDLEARYLLGKPMTPEHLQWVLCNGNQKFRHGAALALAMLTPGTPIFNAAAPACPPSQVQQAAREYPPARGYCVQHGW